MQNGRFISLRVICVGIETSPQKTNITPTVTHHNQSGAVNGITTSPLKASTTNGTIVPPEDRYSALKDLDALFTTQTTTPINEPAVATANWTPSWNAGTASQPVLANQHSESALPFGNNNMMVGETPSAWQPTVFAPCNNSSNPFLGK